MGNATKIITKIGIDLTDCFSKDIKIAGRIIIDWGFIRAPKAKEMLDRIGFLNSVNL